MASESMKRVGLMVRKELRENAKWTGIGLIVMAIACGVQLRKVIQGSGTGDIWDSYFNVMLCCGPLLAVALGFLQVAFERSRDRWAFMIHRPITRPAIAASKSIAGIALLTAMLGVPYLLFALWMSIPGHAAGPFDWRLGEAVLSLTVSAWCCHLAALLAAGRTARWYGSKLMPIMAGAIVVFASYTQTLALSLMWLTIAIAIFAVALLHAFGAIDTRPKRPTLGAFALGSILAVGAWVTVIICSACIIYANGIDSRMHWRDYELTENDQVVLVKYENATASEVDTPSGGFLERLNHGIPENDPQHPGAISDISSMLVSLRQLYNSTAIPNKRPPFNNPNRYFEAIEGSSPTNWYLRDSTLLSYSKQSLELETVLGPHGSRRINSLSAIEPDDKFQHPRTLTVDGQYAEFIVDDNGVYQVDYNRATIGTILSGPEAQQVLWITNINNRNLKNSLNIIGTATEMRLYDSGFQYLRSIPYTPMQKKANITVGLRDNGNLVLFYMPQDTKAQVQFAEYDLAGKLIRQENWPNKAIAATSAVGASPMITIGGTPLVTAACLAVMKIMQPHSPARQLFGGGVILKDYAIGQSILLLLGILSTALIAKRCALSVEETVAWIVGNAIVGWPGVFVMLAMRPWPAREACGQCGRQRVVTRDICEHCGTAWPEVVKDGTEIFEDDDPDVHPTVGKRIEDGGMRTMGGSHVA